jgi:glyoxylase I family protein
VASSTEEFAMLIHHIALGACDVEEVARFYRDYFDLPEVARHDDAQGTLRSIWLESGGTVLMIERSEEPPRIIDGVGAGPFLIAFLVEEAARLTLEVRLENAGYRVESRTAYTSYTRDPEGNRVAFSHYPLP